MFIVVELRGGAWIILTWIVILSFLPMTNAQTPQNLYWDLGVEEDFLMYELIFRDSEDREIGYPVNITFGSELPEIAENIVNWSQIPNYPVSMKYSNGTQLTDLSKFIPGYTYTVLPVGNWELLSSLVEIDFNHSFTLILTMWVPNIGGIPLVGTIMNQYTPMPTRLITTKIMV